MSALPLSTHSGVDPPSSQTIRVRETLVTTPSLNSRRDGGPRHGPDVTGSTSHDSTYLAARTIAPLATRSSIAALRRPIVLARSGLSGCA